MKKAVAFIIVLMLLCQCAYAAEENLLFGLKVGDSFDHVSDVMTAIFGEGKFTESTYSQKMQYKTEQTNILGLRLSGASVECSKRAKGGDKCAVSLYIDASDLLKEKDFSKLFTFYDSLCSFIGEPEESSHIISSVDFLGNVAKDSILKHQNEFEKEVSKSSEVEITETWSNVELSIKIRSFTNSCNVYLYIYTMK